MRFSFDRVRDLNATEINLVSGGEMLDEIVVTATRVHDSGINDLRDRYAPPGGPYQVNSDGSMSFTPEAQSHIDNSSINWAGVIGDLVSIAAGAVGAAGNTAVHAAVLVFGASGTAVSEVSKTDQ